MGGRIILARAPLAIRAVGEAVIEALSLVVTQESTQIKGFALLVKAFTLACLPRRRFGAKCSESLAPTGSVSVLKSAQYGGDGGMDARIRSGGGAPPASSGGCLHAHTK